MLKLYGKKDKKLTVDLSTVNELKDTDKILIASNGKMKQIDSSLIDLNGGGNIPSGPTFNDGKTRLFITIPDLTRPDMTIFIGCTVAGGVTIDWGDGGSTMTTVTTTPSTYMCTYNAAGDYIISLEVTDGELLLEGNPGDQMGIVGPEPYKRTRIRKVEIGDDVIIGDGAFYNCTALTSIVIPEGVTSIGGGAFYNCSALTSVVIPSGVTSIGMSAFEGCSSLTSVVIPSSVTSISGGAFNECIDLTSITMPEGVTSIGPTTFCNCAALTSITIPSNVTSIGPDAFTGCVSMATYYFEPSVPPTITSTTFDLLPADCKIHVPYDSWNEYKNATNWVQLRSHLVTDGGGEPIIENTVEE